ncbi:hypothetical protein KY284_033244 [Solanum tuberosum]|nr:hypothetical protein KY284_033244 [Solanum tuberosum]
MVQLSTILCTSSGDQPSAISQRSVDQHPPRSSNCRPASRSSDRRPTSRSSRRPPVTGESAITINHKGEHLTECIRNCLLDWNLDNVFTVMVDNASSNDVAILELSKKLDTWGTNMMDDGSIAGSIQNEVWTNVRNVTKFLEKFYELTLKVSGSRYLSKMASGMKEKFKKCWGTPEKMNKMFFIASVLDPRNKFVYVSFAPEELLGEEKGKIVNNEVETYLKKLFAIYLARDILAISMSSVASKCAFSSGDRIIDPFRSSLTPKCVQCLICVQEWLRQETKSICVEESLEFLEKIELGPRVKTMKKDVKY